MTSFLFLVNPNCNNNKNKQKEAKEHDEYAVGTFIQESSKLVGHVIIELYFLVSTFTQAHEVN